MKILVGLGNPGEKYEGTRHNIGFATLDHLLKKYEKVDQSVWEDNKKTKSQIKKLTIGEFPVILAKPQTFMNNSGMALSLLTQYFKVKPEEVIIVHDDLDLPLGKIQIRFGGGSAGHNGIESVIEALKTDKFTRIRMGIGHPKTRIKNKELRIKSDDTVSNYVVSHFSEGEHKDVRNMIKHVQKNLELLLEHGIDTFMSKFNSREGVK